MLERPCHSHRSSPAKSGPPPDRPKPPAPPPPPRWRSWLPAIGLLISIFIFSLLSGGMRQNRPQELSYTDLKAKVAAGQVQSVTIDDKGHINGKLRDGGRFTSGLPTALGSDELAKLLAENNVQVKSVEAQTSIGSVLLSLLPLLLFVAFFIYLGRSTRRQLASGIGGIGRSRAKVFDMERPETTFADVAGYEGPKREVNEVVDFLKNPDRFKRAGAVGPKGVLMVGPPGTGKTLLARAVAGEASVPFLSVTGSSFVEMFVGVGAARVRDLFADARRRAPSIIFMDEIDAIGQRRGGAVVSNDERDQTLNQMLAEMDGFDPANLVNEAAIFAVRAGREVLTAVDFSEARDRVLLGLRDASNALLPDEQRAVAVHEGGHALVAALSKHADPVAKVTILPAGMALGVTEQLPVDERHLYSEGYLKDSLAVRMGGRAAEQLVFGEGSTGASNDLAGATGLATRMVREFGMSPALGPVGFSSESPMYLGGEEVRSRPYAEATQRVIDEEVAKLLRAAEGRAAELLASHRDALDRLTELLLERETVDGTDVDEILGRVPGRGAPIGATGHAAGASEPGPPAGPATR